MQGRIHTFLMAITHRPAGRTFFFFNDTATPEFYTLSLHDALPISSAATRDRATRQSIPLVLPQTSLRRARGIVHHVHQAAPRTTPFQPVVETPVQLHPFAKVQFALCVGNVSCLSAA